MRETPDSAMRRAIRLSRRGYPAPNPHVGCVLIKDGRKVGEGFHDHYGGPHAEVVALQQAGRMAAGADAYVTLEPCNHTGLTGPCSEALIAARVRSVTFAVLDPNPKAAGGRERLEAAGIAVQSGLLAPEAEEANLAWLTAVRRRRPFVVLKAAASLDSKSALPTGESKWITGEKARERGHQLRALAGAVLVGRRTVMVDDPQLTARIKGVVNQPKRIILDRAGQLDPSHKVFDAQSETLRIVGPGAKQSGLVAPLADGGFDLPQVMDMLFERGITSLLVEGGPATLGGFINAGLGDRIHLFMAPKLLGAGTDWVSGLQVSTLAQAPQFKILKVNRLDPDIEVILGP